MSPITCGLALAWPWLLPSFMAPGMTRQQVEAIIRESPAKVTSYPCGLSPVLFRYERSRVCLWCRGNDDVVVSLGRY